MSDLPRACRYGQDRRFCNGLVDHFAKLISACAVLVCCSCLCSPTWAQTTGGRPDAISGAPYSASSALTTLGLIILQVDESSDEAASTQENANELNCMQARATFRNFDNISWILTVGLAFLVYYLWLVLRPRWLSSAAKWTISPLISSILVARIVASFENFQLTHYCTQPSEWRFATFATTLVVHCLIAFGFFIVLAIYRSVRRTRRLTILKTE
jgi:hypothetical protein